MRFLKFIDNSVDLDSALSGAYDPALVMLSVLIACLGSFATFELADRIRVAERRSSKLMWLATGAAAMGASVWAMHFIGMLAFSLPLAVRYDLLITLLSMGPAVFAGGVMLYILGRPELKNRELVVGGVFIGSGIAAMHYSGMAAMLMDAVMRYDPVLFVVSMVVAVVLAIIALRIKHLVGRKKPEVFVSWTKLGSALVMGSAVAAMHYTAMAAVRFFPAEVSGGEVATLNTWYLAVSVGLVTMVIIVLANVASLFGRRQEIISLLEMQIAERKQAEEALRVTEELFRDVSEAASDRFWEMDETLRFTSMFDHPGSEVFPPTSTFIGRTRWEMAGMDPDKDEKWGRHRDEHLARRPFRDFEFAIKDKDGVYHYRSVNGKPFFDKDGVFRGYRGSITDITDRKNAEEDRERALVQAELVDRF